MKTNYDPNNRRRFIKSLSLGTAFIALSPNISFGKSALNTKLSISFSNTSFEKIAEFSEVFLQNPNFTVNKNQVDTFLHYFNTGTYSDVLKFEHEILHHTILIINQKNFDAHSLSHLQNLCSNNEVFLLMIEENLQASTQIMFSKATLFEPKQCDISQIENIVKSISYLNQLTQHNQFFTINQSLALNSTII